MWDVSPAFLDQVRGGGGDVRTLFTVGDLPCQLTYGSVNVQPGTVRRTLRASLSPVGISSLDLYDQVSVDGVILRVEAGFPNLGEYVPVFTGRLSTARLNAGDGGVEIAAADLGFDASQQELIPPVVQSDAMTRVDAIIALIEDAFPGVVIVNRATDDGTLGSSQTWSGTVAAAVEQIATDGGMTVGFDAGGRFVIADKVGLTEPVHTFKTGPSGTVTAFARERPLDQLYNAVIVRPAATDGSQGWSQVVVQIDDPYNPRHPDLIGLRPYVHPTPIIGNETQATIVAEQLLIATRGRTERVAVTAVGNPALETGDTVRVIAEAWQDAPVQTVTHLVDGYTFDLNSWGQSLNTRSVGVEDV